MLAAARSAHCAQQRSNRYTCASQPVARMESARPCVYALFLSLLDFGMAAERGRAAAVAARCAREECASVAGNDAAASAEGVEEGVGTRRANLWLGARRWKGELNCAHGSCSSSAAHSQGATLDHIQSQHVHPHVALMLLNACAPVWSPSVRTLLKRFYWSSCLSLSALARPALHIFIKMGSCFSACGRCCGDTKDTPTATFQPYKQRSAHTHTLHTGSTCLLYTSPSPRD